MRRRRCRFPSSPIRLKFPIFCRPYFIYFLLLETADLEPLSGPGLRKTQGIFGEWGEFGENRELTKGYGLSGVNGGSGVVPLVRP